MIGIGTKPDFYHVFRLGDSAIELEQSLASQ
jgi:hypothetical protein